MWCTLQKYFKGVETFKGVEVLTPRIRECNRIWFIGKDSDAGRDWGQEEKGMTEDEMAGWHH